MLIEHAYGLYVVYTNSEKPSFSYLMLKRSRVAPLKTLSFLRLELKTALLLSQLYNSIKTVFNNKIQQIKLWNDSTIVGMDQSRTTKSQDVHRKQSCKTSKFNEGSHGVMYLRKKILPIFFRAE